MSKFLIHSDPVRKYEAWGEFLPDGRLHVTAGQWVSDEDMKAIRVQRDLLNDTRKRSNTQDHMVPVMVIPDAIMENLMKDSDGNPLDPLDPERDKIKKRFMNDSEYRDLRIYEGRV